MEIETEQLEGPSSLFKPNLCLPRMVVGSKPGLEEFLKILFLPEPAVLGNRYFIQIEAKLSPVRISYPQLFAQLSTILDCY